MALNLIRLLCVVVQFIGTYLFLIHTLALLINILGILSFFVVSLKTICLDHIKYIQKDFLSWREHGETFVRSDKIGEPMLSGTLSFSETEKQINSASGTRNRPLLSGIFYFFIYCLFSWKRKKQSSFEFWNSPIVLEDEIRLN